MSDIYLDVTNKIVSALSQGVIPWIKPWTTSGSSADAPFPINAITRRPYAGINIPLLWAEARLRGYRQDRWLTYNQARKAGGHVRKGEQSTLAVLYKPMSKEAHDEDGQVVRDEQGNVKMVQFALLRTHCLFNIEQTEGLPNEEQPHDESEDPAAHASTITTGMTRSIYRYGISFNCPLRPSSWTSAATTRPRYTN